MNRASREKQRMYRQVRAQRMADARARGTHSEQEWTALVRRFSSRCVRCWCMPCRVEKDHITPVYQGGSDAITNLQPLCASCNASKGSESKNWVIARDMEAGIQ